jgi:hypothetical protein
MDDWHRRDGSTALAAKSNNQWGAKKANVGAKRQMGRQKANVGAKRQMGHHKGIWGAKKAYEQRGIPMGKAMYPR